MNVKKSFMRFTNHLVGFVRFILDIPKNMKNVRKIQLRRAFLTSFAVLCTYQCNAGGGEAGHRVGI